MGYTIVLVSQEWEKYTVPYVGNPYCFISTPSWQIMKYTATLRLQSGLVDRY
jgi:hypothetical protein